MFIISVSLSSGHQDGHGAAMSEDVQGPFKTKQTEIPKSQEEKEKRDRIKATGFQKKEF